MKRRFLLFFFLFTLLLITLTKEVYAELSKGDASIKQEVIYDLLVDRYHNLDRKGEEEVDINDPFHYHGGDFKGITAQLEEIKHNGFTVLSLSSVFANDSEGYHGYWIEDFYKIEEQFGGLEDLKELIETAHEKDLKVILEFVPNYVSVSSPLVAEKLEKDWFTEVKAEPTKATSWLDQVLQFNHQKEEVREYLLDVALYWIETLSIDGYKIHAADQADEAFIKELTERIKKVYPDFYILVTSLQGASLEKFCQTETIDAIEDEGLRKELVAVFSQADVPVSRFTDYMKKFSCDKFLLKVDDRQSPRFSQRVAEEGRNHLTTWKLALSMLYFSPGIPLIYQGSEVPMYGASYPESEQLVDLIRKDPDLVQVFQRVGAAKEAFPALSYGSWEEIAVEGAFSIFKREWQGETVYVAVNNGSESHYVALENIEAGQQLRGLFYDDTVRADAEGKFYIGLDRETADIFVLEEDEGIHWGFILLLSLIMLGFLAGLFYLSLRERKRKSLS